MGFDVQFFPEEGTNQEKVLCQSEMKLLKAQLPFDASICLCIQKESGQYKGVLKSESSQGHFAASANEASFKEFWETLKSKMKKQIIAWQKVRGDVEKFDPECDHYWYKEVGQELDSSTCSTKHCQ